MYGQIKKLSQKLESLELKSEAKQANNIADVMSKKKKIVKNIKELFKVLDKEEGLQMNIDSPKGSKKGFGDKNKIKKKSLPFDYGEISGLINPADNMPWDIIIPPSLNKSDFKKIIPIGIIKYKDDKKMWKDKADKLPPIGNDKIIISPNGEISDEDKEIIDEFFNSLWQFEKIKWI